MLWMILLTIGAVLAILVYPILGSREAWDLNEAPDRLRNLKRSRDRAMRTLKDLENDCREGSLLESDYEDLRRSYKQQAIQLSKELSRVREAVVRQIKEGPPRPQAHRIPLLQMRRRAPHQLWEHSSEGVRRGD